MGNETIYWDGLTAFMGKAIDTFPKMNLGVSLEGKVTFYAENLCALTRHFRHSAKDKPYFCGYICTCSLASAKFPEMEIPLLIPQKFL